MTKLAVLLLLMQTGFAEMQSSPAEDLEQEPFYPPLFYGNADPFFDGDATDPESKKDESPTEWHGRFGKARISGKVENIDFLSQCKAEWEKMQKKDEPKKKGSSSRKDQEDKKKSHAPQASVSISWSSED